jgi:hypothetical protein
MPDDCRATIRVGSMSLRPGSRERPCIIRSSSCAARYPLAVVLGSMLDNEVLRDHRRAANTLIAAESGIADLRNITLTGRHRATSESQPATRSVKLRDVPFVNQLWHLDELAAG